MKKLIASLLVLVFGATMVMAEMPSPTLSQLNTVSSSIRIDNNSLDSLPDEAFLDVSGQELNNFEMTNVKGEAVWMVVVAAVVIFTVAAAKAY